MLPDKNKLAEEVRVGMARLQITNTDMAKAMDVSKQTVWKMKQGEVSYPTFEKAFKTLDKWEAK